FGMWFGGHFPPGDVQGQACSGQATLIFLRDVVMRSSLLEVAYRQRLIETVVATPDGLEFRLVPISLPAGGVAGGRLPPDIGFSCDGNPNLLRVRRIGPHEIILPGCPEFPAVLRRCIPD
ncbi:MAG: hypothetical protein N2588_10540, partial [Rhodovarius sp.]|nr:hypothetical protein [Rhodovarius sp.]